MKFLARLKVLLTIRDLEPGAVVTEESLQEHLRSFDLKDLAQTLAKLNFLYFSDELRKSKRLRVSLLKRYFPPDLFERVRPFLLQDTRPLMHPLLVPGLLERILRIDPSEGGTMAAPEHLEEVGQLLLEANLLFYPDEPAAGDESAVISQLGADFYRDSFFAHEDNFGSSFARYWAMFAQGQAATAARHPTEVFPVEDVCRELFGMSPEDVFCLGIGVLSRYTIRADRLLKEPAEFLISPGFFRTLPSEEARNKASGLLRRLSRTWEAHRTSVLHDVANIPSGRYRLFSLYDAPLVALSEEVSYPFDVRFLRHQLSEGLPWALLAALRGADRKKEGDRALQWLGRLFEWYLFRLIDFAIHREGSTRCFLEWDETLTGSGHRLPDAVIVERRCAFFIEATTSAVPPRSAISSDATTLIEGLKRVWFGSGPKTSAKLVQLAGAVKAFQDGTLKLEGVSPKEVTRIVPVLVVLRHLPQNEVLWKLYRRVMRDEGLPASFVENLAVIDIDDWEALLSLRVEGKKLQAMIDARRASDYRDDEFQQFLSARGLYGRRLQPVEEWLNQVNTRAEELLLGEKAGSR